MVVAFPEVSHVHVMGIHRYSHNTSIISDVSELPVFAWRGIAVLQTFAGEWSNNVRRKFQDSTTLRALERIFPSLDFVEAVTKYYPSGPEKFVCSKQKNWFHQENVLYNGVLVSVF